MPTIASPPVSLPATFFAPRNSIISTLIEPRESRLESLRAARVVHLGALVRRHRGDLRLQSVEELRRVGGKLAAPRLGAEHDAELLELLHRGVEVPVEEDVRDAGLLLHAVGERGEGRVGRAHVDDEIGLGLQHHLDVGRVAAPGEPPELGQVRVLLRNPRRFVGAEGARPADQLVGGEREHEHRRRRPGGEDALDLVGDLDLAARVVDERARGGAADRQQEGKREGGRASLIVFPSSDGRVLGVR